MKKRILALSAVLSLSMAVPAFAGIGVMIDERTVPFSLSSGSPIIDENSRTLVPLRAAMEAFGCDVSWDEPTKTATVTKDDTTVKVPVGRSIIYVDYVPVVNDTSAKIVDGRVYLPIRAVLEAFGASVGWDEKTQSVSVTSAEYKEALEESQRKIEERQKELEEEQKRLEEERQQRLDEMEQRRKELLEEIEEAKERAEELAEKAYQKKQSSIYDSISNSSGYSNSYAGSLGYDISKLTGGYGSTYAAAVAQQYKDNLLASGKR